MWTCTLAVMGTSSAAGGEQPDQGGRGVPPDRVVDVALFPAALDQARTPEDVEVVRRVGPGTSTASWISPTGTSRSARTRKKNT